MRFFPFRLFAVVVMTATTVAAGSALDRAHGIGPRCVRRALRAELRVRRKSLDWLRIKNMRVGDAAVDLGFSCYDQDVAVNVSRKEGDVEVAVVV